MSFNSLEFLIFFVVVTYTYFILNHRYRWLFLLAASYYFYMSWNVEYVALILTTTVSSYVFGLLMGTAQSIGKKRTFLISSIVFNLGILFVFKYFNFFNTNLKQLCTQLNISYSIPSLDFLLPVGISFYTFQTLSYSIDVYRGNKTPERHFGIFALYVAFFPQLVAGPIERSTHLLPQFLKKNHFDYDRVRDGLLLMAWGFFKKIVIADRLALIVNQIYNNPYNYQGIPLIAATYFFTFQIYCDFSGYSDIAIGAARVLGYDIIKNFNRPYISQSVAEFWRRWHISLSTWFRDYVYFPLGGNRVSRWRWYYNIIVVFLVSGLWHGAQWTFVLWGLIHGLCLILGAVTKKYRVMVLDNLHIRKSSPVLGAFRIFITFHIVVLAWIFFRARDINTALYIIKNLVPDVNSLALRINAHEFYMSIMFIAVLLVTEMINQKIDIISFIKRQKAAFRWGFYYLFMMCLLILARYGEQQFIYFQF